jgi:outer membrane protein OmpA-like peptidoglycan-associated protein
MTKIKAPNLIQLALYCTILMVLSVLQGCASSAAANGAASNADRAYLDARYQLTHPGDGLRDSYQNSPQLTKGVIIGGAVGAAAGGATSGVAGVLPGVGLGAIFGGAIGAYIDSHTTLEDKLRNRNIQVVNLGDQVLVVLPSFVIFDTLTSNLLPASYATLDLVREYINQFHNMSIKIAGFTSATEPMDISIMLSKQQAEQVAKYLWNRGINTRLLVAEGYGGSKNVSGNQFDWSSDNYRIEITLEKLLI